MSFSEYNYNTEGSVSSIKDFEGNVTFYDYDAFGRMKKSTRPGDVITTFDYDYCRASKTFYHTVAEWLL